MDVNLLHNKAMDIAEAAYLAKLNNDQEKYIGLSREALELEKQAANILLHNYEYEPSRSILFRSAATLAMDCGELREAERLIASALIGHPPDDIANELRDLLEKVNFQRHLDLRGITLEQDEFQFSIVGGSVGFGIALSDPFVDRVQNFEKLLYRTAERKLGKCFREKGKIPNIITKNYPVYLTVPRPCSFAITFKIGRPTKQLSLDLPSVNTSIEIIDEVAECFTLLNESKSTDLKTRIPDKAYYNNFIGLARQIAPDGDEVTQVGITIIRNNKERRIPLVKIQKEIVGIETKNILLDKDERASVRGSFLFADSMSKDKRIRIIDEIGNKYDVRVPPGMMSDIVKPLWEDVVIVEGIRKKNVIYLEEIRKAEE